MTWATVLFDGRFNLIFDFMKTSLLLFVLFCLAYGADAQEWRDQFDQIGPVKQGLMWVKKGKKYGYVNEEGSLVIPLRYTDAGDFSEDLAWVEKRNRKWGCISGTGKRIIKFKYDDARPFQKDYAWVCRKGQTFYIDKVGRLKPKQ